jgi:DNA-binding transcriptional LysR family regulator
MDYKSMLYALTVAETRSFVRAAEKVSLTQSAISRSIIALEKELGITLFDRTITGATLTPAGEIFMQRARNIVGEMQALKTEVTQYQTEISGGVTIGSAPTLAVSHLTSLLSDSVKNFPRLQIRVEVNIWNKLCESLRQGAIDFFIEVRASVIDSPDLNFAAACSFRGMGVFCRPDHPLLALADTSPECLRDYPIVTGGLSRTIARSYRNLLRIDNDTPLNVALVCDNLMMLVRVVLETDALLVTAPEAMAVGVERGVLVELPIEYPAPLDAKGEIVIVTAKSRTLSPAAVHLIKQFHYLHRS